MLIMSQVGKSRRRYSESRKEVEALRNYNRLGLKYNTSESANEVDTLRAIAKNGLA
jgi:hypothetical protein